MRGGGGGGATSKPSHCVNLRDDRGQECSSSSRSTLLGWPMLHVKTECCMPLGSLACSCIGSGYDSIGNCFVMAFFQRQS